MATELAMRAHMDTHNDRKENEKDETDLQYSNSKSEMISQIDIQLGNPMKSMGKECVINYVYNWRLLIPLIVSILLMLLSSSRLYGFYHPTITVVMYVSCAAMSIVYVLLLIYSASNKSQSPLDEWFGFHTPGGTYSGAKQHICVFVLLMFLYGSIVSIIFEATSLSECRVAEIVDDKCAVFYSTFAESLPIGISLILFLYFRSIDLSERTSDHDKVTKYTTIEETDDKLNELKQPILDRFRNTKAIEKGIAAKVEEWKDRKKISSRKFEIVCLGLLLVIGTICIQTYRNLISNDDLPETTWLTWAVCIFLNALDGLIATFIAYKIDTFYFHLTYSSIVMEQLSLPLNANNVDDIIGWWELRKFYIHCVLPICASLYGVVVSVGLGFCTIIFLIAFGLFGKVHMVVIIFALMAPCVMLGYTFAVVASAVGYHTHILSHQNTVNRERMQLDRNDLFELVNNAQSSEYRAIRDRIIDEIVSDIQNNSSPFSVVGVRLDANFMLGLRGFAITVFVGFILQFEVL